MKCKRCPFAVACLSGALFKMNNSETFLCVRCTRFVLKETYPVPESMQSRTHIPRVKKVVMFRCERRSMTDSSCVPNYVAAANATGTPETRIKDPVLGIYINAGVCPSCILHKGGYDFQTPIHDMDEEFLDETLHALQSGAFSLPIKKP
jgi:hypothetical protein